MNINYLFRGLNYLNEVSSIKQTYYVFQHATHFIVLTLKTDGKTGNFSIVEKAAVEYVFSKIKGKKNITKNDIKKYSKKPNYTGTDFDVLNIMYILVALRKATIDKRFSESSLHFNVMSE